MLDRKEPREVLGNGLYSSQMLIPRLPPFSFLPDFWSYPGGKKQSFVMTPNYENGELKSS